MKKNPLLDLEKFGQSIWLDYLQRDMLDNGTLKDWIDKDGVSGLTSNPSIFEKAISNSHEYDQSVQALSQHRKSTPEIYKTLTVEDIQRAADLFRPTYDRLDGADGYVSLEVSPNLAHDTTGSLAEARELWAAVARPNLFIKIPATEEGIPAIQQLISEGINVNITLLFGLPRYRQVIDAYLTGLESLATRGKPIGRVASVASFFLSRIDVLIDPKLEQMDTPEALALRGQVAIASARSAYRIFQEAFNGERFRRLERTGGRPQRLLWASTSTKNPAYSDVKYVEPLIGPATINTVPIETLDAYRDHGQPASRLADDLPQAEATIESLAGVGIDIDYVTQQLEDEGVDKFKRALDQLMTILNQKRMANSMNSLRIERN